MPDQLARLSSSGRDAENPVEATNPGRIRSAAVSDAPDAFSPSPANDWKMMSARPLKLLSSSAKKPTYSTFLISCAGMLSLAHQRPEQTRQRDVDRHQHARQERHIASQQPKAAVDVAAEGLGEPIDDRESSIESSASGKAPPLAATRVAAGVLALESQ